MAYYVYIMTNQRCGTLYIGVTSDIVRRIYEHKEGFVAGFTKKHRLHMLVHVESYDDAIMAIQREKNLKRWNRDWKIGLVNQHNPDWKDLAAELI